MFQRKTTARSGWELGGGTALAPAIACVWLLCSVGVHAQATDAEVLARVTLTAPATKPDLPVHAWLQDAAGNEYLLVICAESRLAGCARPYQVLDANAHAEEYVLARPKDAAARAAASARFSCVYDDGVRLILRATPAEAEELADAGFAIQRMSQTPIVWRRVEPPEQRKGFSPDPRVAAMIPRVQQTDLLALLRQVSGEEPVAVGGDAYTIATRHTRSGTPLQKATTFAYERLQALGLQASYHAWSVYGYSNRNVIATQPGTTRSNEVVLLTAHLDDMPSGTRAPGADDNASGSAAVLTAAKVFSQYRFERTVRFVLFTGEEQGLLGSAQYASAAAAAGDNIVAVFNMDMLAWDGAGGPALRLHTRTVSNPGHSNDLYIAGVFTNVVAGYGLSGNLSPAITPDADDASDHASFWDLGYAALYAEEDYPGDFNPYYHTVNDLVARVALGYFTAYTRAAVGTVAHLAQPTGAVALDVIQVANSDWNPGSGIGAGVFYARHEAQATETGTDPRDAAWSAAASNPNPRWLKIFTDPYGTALMTDSRPEASETEFLARLSVVDSTGTGVSCSNRLRFDFLAPPDTNRSYMARIHIDGRYTQTASDFDCVTNLLAVATNGGFVQLPNLNQVSNGVVYGTVAISTTNLYPPRVAAGPVVTNGQFWVRFSGVPGLSYAVQVSPTVLGPWTTATNLLAGDSGLFELKEPIAAQLARFYRLAQ